MQPHELVSSGAQDPEYMTPEPQRNRAQQIYSAYDSQRAAQRISELETELAAAIADARKLADIAMTSKGLRTLADNKLVAKYMKVDSVQPKTK